MVDIGYDGDELCECCIQVLKNIVVCSFFELEGLDKVEVWIGMCLLMLVGLLMLGCVGYFNLWMNFGQGSFGFIFVVGSVVVLGVLIDNQMLDIFLEGFIWK